MPKKGKQSKASMRLQGKILLYGSRRYDSERDDCEHIAFVRRLFRNGEIRPPICQHCGAENRFPLDVGLQNGEYVLWCASCGQIIFRRVKK